MKFKYSILEGGGEIEWTQGTTRLHTFISEFEFGTFWEDWEGAELGGVGRAVVLILGMVGGFSTKGVLYFCIFENTEFFQNFATRIFSLVSKLNQDFVKWKYKCKLKHWSLGFHMTNLKWAWCVCKRFGTAIISISRDMILNITENPEFIWEEGS